LPSSNAVASRCRRSKRLLPTWSIAASRRSERYRSACWARLAVTRQAPVAAKCLRMHNRALLIPAKPPQAPRYRTSVADDLPIPRHVREHSLATSDAVQQLLQRMPPGLRAAFWRRGFPTAHSYQPCRNGHGDFVARRMLTSPDSRCGRDRCPKRQTTKSFPFTATATSR
jgi:hypothetical protein